MTPAPPPVPPGRPTGFDPSRPAPISWEGPGVPADRLPPVAVFPELGYGLIQPHGNLVPETVTGGGFELVAHPEWRPGFDEVWDLRSVESLDFVNADLLRFMEFESHVGGHLAGTRTLIVVAPDLKALKYMVRGYARVARLFSRQVYALPDAEAAHRDMAARGRSVGPFPTLPRDAGRRLAQAREAREGQARA